MSRTINLNLRNRTRAQKRISQSTTRYNVACWGRQSGKTTFGLDKMIYKPLQGIKGGIYWHILQTYSAAEIAFERQCRQLWGSDLIRKKPHESDLCIFLQNDANVFYKSGDKPQNLRAETLCGAIIDECRQQKKEVWTQVVVPMLGRYDGWADLYSTPNGFDWFYDIYENAKTVNPEGQWSTFHAPSTECWWWNEKQIAQAKASMSEAEFAQEILAEFRDLFSGKAYTVNQGNFTEQSPFTRDGSLLNPRLPIIVGLDFNVGHMRWVLGQCAGPRFYWFDEISVDNTNTQQCSKELAHKIEQLKGRFTKLIIVGDATGKSRHSSASESDYAILCGEMDRCGIKWENHTPESNPPVKERVNTVNTHFMNALGEINMFVNPKNCKQLKRDLERVAWKQGAETILDQFKDKSLTHASDAMGYPVCVLSPLGLNNQVGTLKVINR